MDFKNVTMNCRSKDGNIPLALMSTEVMMELQRLLKEYFDVETDV